MTYTEFCKLKTFKAIYQITGEEDRLKEKCIEQIMYRGGQRLTLRSSEVSIERLMDELYTPDIAGSHKIVVLVDDHGLTKEYQDSLKSYCLKPSSSSTLVMLLDKPLQLEATSIECNSMRPQDMAKWIQTSLEEKGIKIEDGAVTELVSRVGGSLAQTEKELEKLSSYSASITVEDVQNMSQDRSTHKTFELASLVTRGDVKNALYVLHKLIDQGESIQLILASLAWQMRKLVELSRRIEEGGNPFQSATSLGIKFNAYEFINALKGTSSRKLEEKHSLILEADLALKSTQLNEAAVVDTLIVKLCKR